MNDIFNNWIAMDIFSYDIIENWIKYRKANNLPYDEDSYMDWLDDFMGHMESSYQDCVEDEEGDD